MTWTKTEKGQAKKASGMVEPGFLFEDDSWAGVVFATDEDEAIQKLMELAPAYDADQNTPEGVRKQYRISPVEILVERK